MLRNILQNTSLQLKAWLEQKNFESKIKHGQQGTLTVQTQTIPVGQEDWYESFLCAGPNTTLTSVPLRTFAGNTHNQVTKITTNDEVSKHFMSLKEKVEQIRKLQALLGDIADELLAGYIEINKKDGNGRNLDSVIMKPNPEVFSGNVRADRNTRRARLGLAPV